MVTMDMRSSWLRAFLQAALCLLLPFPSPFAPLRAECSPVVAATAAAAPPNNFTLVFDSIAHGNGLRNCSCAVAVHDCDEALANLLCSCHTVPRSALPTRGGLGGARGGLTVWVREPWVLREVLNGSEVSELHLSLCASTPPTMPSGPAQYLALFGLRRLRVTSAAHGAMHPQQALDIASRVGGEPSSSSSLAPSVLRVAFLDVAVLSGAAPLRAYSVSGPPAQTLRQHFPNLPLPLPAPNTQHRDPSEPHTSLLTFIY